MYYIPFLITIIYFYYAVKLSDLPDDSPILTDAVINKVIVNLLVTELLYFISWIYDPFTYTPLNIVYLVLFFVAQDIYFYVVHRFLFHGVLYNLHNIHHNYINTYLAWYCSILEHLILNIGSVVFAFWLFPNSEWVFTIITYLQTYTAVNGHTTNSPHSVHHKFPNKRFGSIYLLDRMMGSF